MSKKVTDLTADELDRLAAEAWFEASKSALKAGVPVVGRERGKIVKRYPDGRTEVLGDAPPLEEVQGSNADQSHSLDANLKRARDIA
jgi:hypothetical protein